MSRKTAKEDKPKGRGGKREGAGRKEAGKVKVTAWVLPSTKAKLGPKPGQAIDALCENPRS